MLFNSAEYAILLALSVVAYYATPHVRLRQVMLLASSLVFYASWIPVYILLLLLVVSLNFIVALNAARGRAIIAFAVAVNLGTLAYFKYTQFGLDTMFSLIGAFGGDAASPAVSIILPLGISFYIFQSIAYIVDVRAKRIEAERDPIRLALFIVFFPQLIAGPICRGAELLPQLRRKAPFELSNLLYGLLLFSCGLALKICFADTLSPFVDEVFAAPAQATQAQAVLAAVGFGCVILGDFWGYSTMAVGSAIMFGIDMPRNFNLPYVATSLQDFWRRWHMTLSFWLRDYLYIPLGGSRGGRVMAARNVFIVMALGGLWHGAAWTFVIWGVLHGTWLGVERVFRAVFADAVARAPKMVTAPLGWAVTMLVVFVGWVFFRAATPGDAIALLTQAVSPGGGSLDLALMRPTVIVVLFALVMIPIHKVMDRSVAMRLGAAGQFALSWWLIVISIILGAEQTQEFIYFQF